MKKSKIIFGTIGVFIILIISVGIYKFNFTNGGDVIPKNDPLNLTYKISGKDYTLVNGRVEKEIAPGSASKEIVMAFGEPVYADLDGDGVADDAVMYITQETGGSGTFFYVVEVINKDGVFKGTDAMFIGDRVAPQNINIIDGRAVANFAERKAGESFAVPPSVGKSIYIKLDTEKMQLGEVAQNFEGESDPSRMTLGMQTWRWISVTYNDGKKIIPKVDKFNLTFKKDGTFSASTDCNGVGGEYTVSGNKITFKKMMSTLMYCEGSQEQDFSKVLTEANSYFFTSKGELILDLKMDSGSAVFR